jgi:hypothetical protein
MNVDYVCDQCGKVLIWLLKGKCPHCGGEVVKKAVKETPSHSFLFGVRRVNREA